MIEIDEESHNKYRIPSEVLGAKRQNVLTWQEAFMLQAVVIAGRSKDPSSQVGACMVDENNRILSLGYNGTPSSWQDDTFPWERKAEKDYHTKYPYVIHAEMNALLSYKGDNKSLEGATIYVTLFPCSNRAKALVQAGVKKVVYLSDKYKETNDNIAAKICFDYCGVKYEEFNPELQRDVVVSLQPDQGVHEIDYNQDKPMSLELKPNKNPEEQK